MAAPGVSDSSSRSDADSAASAALAGVPEPEDELVVEPESESGVERVSELLVAEDELDGESSAAATPWPVATAVSSHAETVRLP